MTMWKQWIQRGVLCGVVLGGLGACSMVQHPAASQIASDDHAGQAVWHEQEAARLRTAAKDELAMADAYRKHPSNMKPDMIPHCESLAGQYNAAADTADKLAQAHRDMMKK